MSRNEFKLQRATITQSRVQALMILPTLDVFEKDQATLGPTGELAVGTFGLEGTEEALHGSIVKAIAGVAHADLAMMIDQDQLIVLAGIFTALNRD